MNNHDTKNFICGFGKHKGKRYGEIPSNYLSWMIKNLSPQKSADAARELGRREDEAFEKVVDKRKDVSFKELL